MRLLLPLSLCLSAVSALWPIPSNYTHGKDVLWIGTDVTVAYKGPQGSAYSTPFSKATTAGAPRGSQIIQAAIQRTHNTIFSKVYVPWRLHPRNSNFEPSTSGKKFITSIVLVQTKQDPANVAKPLDGAVDESYKLTVTDAGQVTATAATSIGLVRALTTFSQLFFEHSQGGSYTNLAPVAISDAPKFAHRGLNMDIARNYFPVQDIKRQIDALAFTKMNRLHLHATDAQSWPLEIPSMPELTAKGAYGPSLTYSASALQDLQYYGALQGVEVFVEIDMPGHTSSVAFSHPDLVAAFNVQPNWDTYCAEPPCGTLKLNSPKVSAFLDKLLADLLPRVKPYTAYMHTGGDEVNANAYALDDTVRSNSTEVLQPLMQKFVDRNHNQVRKLGLTPIVWEEMLLQWNLTLGKDVVVQTWQSDDAVAQTVAKGHKALVGNYNYWYLDCGQGQWLDFRSDSAPGFWPFADYCSPRHNWRVMYSYDPLSGVPADAAHLVLGGEVHIWAEQTDPVNIDRMVWPRACAAAEVLWSGAKDAAGHNRTQVEASPRLADMRERLVAAGVAAEPVQMPFCQQNGTQCAL